MDFEYNKLTKELLAAGYTVDNYPDYVQIDGSRLTGNDPLRNLSHGFEYKRWYSDKFVYKTGCGKYVMGQNVINNLSYMGMEWTHENDSPTFRCPWDKPNCPDNDERLHGMHGGGLCIQCWCVCHRTEEPYDYENSIEKADKERDEEEQRKYQEYSDSHKGRICLNHMFYDERTREWSLRYEPHRCAKICFSQDGYCPILGRQLSKKRGNVYYDLKKSWIRQDGTLFDGERKVYIEKGIRYFEKPASMDICEAFVKVEKERISQYCKMNHHWEMFFDKTLEVEVLNVRAESKPSRDLMQDLEDIQAGISITHASDLEKREKARKKERRNEAQQKRIQRLEKKILEVGYWNMDPYSLDKVHAEKWLGIDRIDELEELRKQKMAEKEAEPEQLSLFDMM